MDVKYKVVEVWPDNHTMVVRYYTDSVTEEMLKSSDAKKENGDYVRCRTDVSIDVPIPEPSPAEIEKLILKNAPIAFLERQEAIWNPNVNTAMVSTASMQNVEVNKTIRIDKPEFDPTFQMLEGPTVEVNETEVWYKYTVKELTLEQVQTLKLTELGNEYAEHLEQGTVVIEIGDNNFPFGTSAYTREVVSGLINGINAGIPIPDPRPLTPKGALEPINVSHEDIKKIAAAIIVKMDQLHSVYADHKKAILQSTVAANCAKLDVTTNWL